MQHELSSSAPDPFGVPASFETPAPARDRLRTLANVTIVALALQALCAVIGVASLDPVVTHHATVARIVIFYFTAFPFLSWFGAAYDDALRHGPLSQSKNLTVGGFFIPVYNMVGPFLAAREIWQRASRAFVGGREWIVWIWWGLWVVRNYAGPFLGPVTHMLLELAAISAAVVFVRALTLRLRPPSRPVTEF